jgi:hypothetical protein
MKYLKIIFFTFLISLIIIPLAKASATGGSTIITVINSTKSKPLHTEEQLVPDPRYHNKIKECQGITEGVENERLKEECLHSLNENDTPFIYIVLFLITPILFIIFLERIWP